MPGEHNIAAVTDMLREYQRSMAATDIGKHSAGLDASDLGLGTVAAVDILQAKLLPSMSQMQLLLRDRDGERLYTAIVPLLRIEDGDTTAHVRRADA